MEMIDQSKSEDMSIHPVQQSKGSMNGQLSLTMLSMRNSWPISKACGKV